MDQGIWVTPILLLPGVALLVLSTATRFGQLHAELHDVTSADVAAVLLRRARLFRNALVSLYIAVTVLALAGLLGGITASWDRSPATVVAGLSIAGIGCVAFAAAVLVRESLLSLHVVGWHADKLSE